MSVNLVGFKQKWTKSLKKKLLKLPNSYKICERLSSGNSLAGRVIFIYALTQHTLANSPQNASIDINYGCVERQLKKCGGKRGGGGWEASWRNMSKNCWFKNLHRHEENDEWHVQITVSKVKTQNDHNNVWISKRGDTEVKFHTFPISEVGYSWWPSDRPSTTASIQIDVATLLRIYFKWLSNEYTGYSYNLFSYNVRWHYTRLISATHVLYNPLTF